jgi:hypothetical protein
MPESKMEKTVSAEELIASRIAPAPFWMRVRRGLEEVASRVSAWSERRKEEVARPPSCCASKAEGTVPSIFLGDISPSQVAGLVVEPISTPR